MDTRTGILRYFQTDEECTGFPDQTQSENEEEDPFYDPDGDDNHSNYEPGPDDNSSDTISNPPEEDETIVMSIAASDQNAGTSELSSQNKQTASRYGKRGANKSKIFKEVEHMLKSNDPRMKIVPIKGKGADGWNYGCELVIKQKLLPFRFCRVCLEAPTPIIKI